MLKQIKKTVHKMKAVAVFVAADDNPMISKIDKYLKGKVSRNNNNNNISYH